MPKEIAVHRFAGLDGLRALAVLAVLIYHGLPSHPNGGFMGVDVFFVLSGFLVTSIIVDQHQSGRFALLNFWNRRLRRIVPATVVLVLGVSAVVLWLDRDILFGFRRQALGALTFTYNWLDIAAGSSYFSAYQPELLRNLWSLGVEMQFYLLCPLLLMLGLRRLRPHQLAIPLWLLAAASAVLMWLLAGPDPTRVYFGTDTHAFGLLLGAGLACWLYGRPAWRFRRGRPVRPRAGVVMTYLGASGLAGIAVLMALTNDAQPSVYPLRLAGTSLLAGLVIVCSSAEGSPLGFVLDVPPLRWVGERSYGFYLWHWPVGVILAMVAPRLGGVAQVVITLVVSLGIAAASYRWIETPVRRDGFGAVYRWLYPRYPNRDIDPGRVLAWVGSRAGAAALVACLALAPAHTKAEQMINEGQQSIQTSRPGGTPVTPSPTPPAQTVTPSPTPPVQTEPPVTLTPPVQTEPSPPDRTAVVQTDPPTGGTTMAPPASSSGRPPMPTGDKITAIGDSVMLACAPAMQQLWPGIAIDAEVSRSFNSGLAIVTKQAGDGSLRDVVIFALADNGSNDVGQLGQLLDVVGPQRTLVLVTGHAPKVWVTEANAAIHQFVTDHPGVLLADWDAAVSNHPDWLVSDQVHPRPDGQTLFATTILAALRLKYNG